MPICGKTPPMNNALNKNGWRERVHEIIFEADTPAGKAFDIALLITILISVAVISLESVQEIRLKWDFELTTVSRVITVLFTIEYVLRLMCVRRPWKYALSFFGIVDLLAILPGLLSFFVEGPEYMSMIRSLRLLRVFHIFQMGPYVTEARNLIAAVRATRAKIIVFLFSLMTIVLILGTAIYIVENPDPQNPDPSNQFTSIPRSVYWAIVTLTTVGYGDIAPQTVAGQVLSRLRDDSGVQHDHCAGGHLLCRNAQGPARGDDHAELSIMHSRGARGGRRVL